MKITGVLIEPLMKKAPHMSKGFAVSECGQNATHLNALKAIHGMLESASMWYRKFCSDLELMGFVFCTCNTCIANRSVNKKQHMMRFHVDDLMSIHVEKKVNDEFLKWSKEQCGEHTKVKATRHCAHNCLGITFANDCLGITFEFIEQKVKIDVFECTVNMLKKFPVKIEEVNKNIVPAGVDLFSEDSNKKLSEHSTKQSCRFHFHVTRHTANCVCLGHMCEITMTQRLGKSV